MQDGEVVGVLDVDSTELNHFDETDAQYLEQIVQLIDFSELLAEISWTHKGIRQPF